MTKVTIEDFDKKMDEIRKKHQGSNPFQSLRDSLKRRISGSKTPKA